MKQFKLTVGLRDYDSDEDQDYEEVIMYLDDNDQPTKIAAEYVEGIHPKPDTGLLFVKNLERITDE